MASPMSRSWLLSIGASLALLHGRPAVLLAQSSAEMLTDASVGGRSGFHLSLGLGAGRADITCAGCVFDSRTGYSAFLSVARSIGRNTLLGIEATGWKKDGVDIWIFSLMPQVTQYLNRTSGLFLSAGMGWTGFRQEEDGSGELSWNDFGISGRLGYELGVGRVAVVPYVGYLRGLGAGSLTFAGNDVETDPIVQNFQLGLSIAVP